MSSITVKAVALIADRHVEHGVPSVLEISKIEAAVEALGGIDPATLAHDTFTALGWRVEMVDAVIRGSGR